MLPIEAMGFDETHLQGLIEVGITRVEDVLAMSRKALVSRFDPRVLECIERPATWHVRWGKAAPVAVVYSIECVEAF